MPANEEHAIVRILVTGSAGHLGEALVRTLRDQNYQVIGIDRLPSEFTNRTGTIVDRAFVRQCMSGIDTVLHAATLHKPHVATHRRQEFVDVNVYVNERARRELGWEPRHNFSNVLDRLRTGENLLSPLAHLIGAKGYHSVEFPNAPYPVDRSEDDLA